MCTNCGDCIPACHVDALSLVDGKISFAPDACDQCDDCIKACPINANPMVQSYSVRDILDIARKNLVFLDGITMSGGEATTQLKFIVALFKAIKEDAELCALSCFIDTNGHLSESSWEKVLPYTDGVMLDIKAVDDDIHHKLTGKSNARSLSSAKILHNVGKLFELRYLVIPDFTDEENEVERFCQFTEAIGGDIKVKLNAFQHHGVVGEALGWPKTQKATIEDIATKLRNRGISQVATPSVYV